MDADRDALASLAVLTISATRMAVLSLVVATWTHWCGLGVVSWRVCPSHYRQRIPVSAFLYLYPRLNSCGSRERHTQANFPSAAAGNCVPRARNEPSTASPRVRGPRKGSPGRRRVHRSPRMLFPSSISAPRRLELISHRLSLFPLLERA